MFYIVLLTGIFIDLYTKNLALNYLQDRVDIFANLLYLQYVENTGIAFSIYVPNLLLKVLTIILIIAIFLYYFLEKKKEKSILFEISFGLILAGAIGNGYERVFNEKVIDLLGVTYFSVFNIADAFISIGAFLYIVSLFIETGLNNKK